jgi:hypothetical protein
MKNTTLIHQNCFDVNALFSDNAITGFLFSAAHHYCCERSEN